MIGLEVSELRQRLQALGYLFSADNADEAAVALENSPGFCRFCTNYPALFLFCLYIGLYPFEQDFAIVFLIFLVGAVSFFSKSAQNSKRFFI